MTELAGKVDCNLMNIRKKISDIQLEFQPNVHETWEGGSAAHIFTKNYP